MNIIYDLLTELGYAVQKSFDAIYDETKVINVMPFISMEYKSQVYLVVSCLNSQLDEIINTDYVKAIAQKFRIQPFHFGEMDRNTSLLILSQHRADENINKSAKVKIEDDPYYFKKYVLSYDDVAEKNTEVWMRSYMKDGSVVNSIQEYIGNTSKFEAYKSNHQNEAVYSYLIEIVTKIPNFPMRIIDQQGIDTVDFFLKEELDKLRSKKKPIDINVQQVEKLMEIDLDTMKLEDILMYYNGNSKDGE